MLNLVHLRSLLTLEQVGSFTVAADMLGIGQPAVSMHIQRLEKQLGRRLVHRDTHMVKFTSDGEALLGYARSMLELNDNALALFEGNRLRGKLRLGVSEDLVANSLSSILEYFMELYPQVDIELTVALSAPLNEMLAKGAIDAVLAKRVVGQTQGKLLYRDKLVWLARDPERLLEKNTILPLIVFPPPSITRTAAQNSLNEEKRPWRIVCSCESLSGLVAAARAGMGLIVQPRSLTPRGLREASPNVLPQLNDIEIVLVPRMGVNNDLVDAICSVIEKYYNNRNPTFV